jgi:glycosyltransferase involved in cell wall biosynthesis
MTNSSTTVAVVICTYKRNEPLKTLLEGLLVCADRVKKRAAVGVVVVDDTAEGNARGVVGQFEGRFQLGITYRISGRQNISLARNLAIESGSEIADWTAMIDDDCEPVPDWLEAMLDTQQRTGADAVTGTMVRRVPAGSPKWLTEEPFLEYGLQRSVEGAQLPLAATFNSMISSRWLKDHPTIRFQPELGVTSGEDMVFYGSARAAGLKIHYSERAYVFENEPPSRATLSYQLQAFFWHGNSTYVTSVRIGKHPFRMLVHGANSMRKALMRPILRLSRGESPQMRYCLASMLHATGIMIGVCGVRLKHPL